MNRKHINPLDNRRNAEPRSVVMVHPHPVTRIGFGQVVAATTDPSLQVVGEASSRREAQTLISQLSPDLVVTTLELAADDGLELVSWLRHSHPAIRVLVLSSRDPATFGERALRAGALGYVCKDASVDVLQYALREVLAGRIYAPAALTERVMSAVTGRRVVSPDDPLDLLSDRELQVFEHLGSGRSSREVAETLGLSVKTIASHRANIQVKLGGVSLPELLRRAVLWVESRDVSGLAGLSTRSSGNKVAAASAI